VVGRLANSILVDDLHLPIVTKGSGGAKFEPGAEPSAIADVVSIPVDEQGCPTCFSSFMRTQPGETQDGAHDVNETMELVKDQLGKHTYSNINIIILLILLSFNILSNTC
jgi:hypothetical protein